MFDFQNEKITKGMALFVILLLLFSFVLHPVLADQPTVSWKDTLRGIIRQEMADKNIPSFALVIVDRDGVVVKISEGVLESGGEVPISPATLFRTGSVGKTITDLAIMAAVEEGRLDIDADVRTYLPGFHPENSFGTPITLKNLMTHTAGLVREPPIGNYFDDRSPTLEATVLSLNQTKLLWEAGSKTKYSNAGLAVAGLVLQRIYGRPYAEIIRAKVFGPAGMTTARVGYSEDIEGVLAHGRMWWPDGRQWDAPLFDLGMLPAGDLYASPNDMAALMQALLKNDGTIVAPELLETMWRPHETPDKADWHLDVGIGFSLNGKFLGNRKLARHGGAVYGYATELGLLPEEGLGVYAVAAKDITNGVVSAIAYWALESALAERERKPMPAYKMTGASFTSLPAKVADCTGSPPPDNLKPYEGVYGKEHNPLTICARDGRLYALIEWFFLYPLNEVGPGIYSFPSSALYGYETLRFEGGAERAEAAIIGNGKDGVRFERR